MERCFLSFQNFIYLLKGLARVARSRKAVQAHLVLKQIKKKTKRSSPSFPIFSIY